MKKVLLQALAALLVVGIAGFSSSQAQEENTGPNGSILRWAEGAYQYLGDNGERERGIEKFRMNVHPDGTRTLIMWHDLYARNLQYSVILRVEENFRPLQAFANFWTENGYKGSTFITVKGDTMETITHGPVGQVTQAIDVPHGLSIGSHPVSGDGWHMWHVDPDAEGVQRSGALYGIESSGDLSKPPLGALTYMPMEVMGEETVTVPAGTFETTKYRLAGRTLVWVTMPDRIVVKMNNSGRGHDYVLTRLERGDNS